MPGSENRVRLQEGRYWDMRLLQLALYCLLFILPVKCVVRSSGLNCLYFYPREYIDEAQRRGIAEKAAVMKKGKRFMIPF